MRVGFIGPGSQGAPMAHKIIEAGHAVTLWARRPAPLRPFADTPAAVADSPAEPGGQMQRVRACVVGDGIVVVYSTVHPETCRSLASRAGEIAMSFSRLSPAMMDR